jgi:hypothetical protein
MKALALTALCLAVGTAHGGSLRHGGKYCERSKFACPPGTVVLYDFNTGAATDYGPNEHHGTEVGGPTHDEDGGRDGSGCYAFDDTDGVYVLLDNDIYDTLLTVSQGTTICDWRKDRNDLTGSKGVPWTWTRTWAGCGYYWRGGAAWFKNSDTNVPYTQGEVRINGCGAGTSWEYHQCTNKYADGGTLVKSGIIGTNWISEGWQTWTAGSDYRSVHDGVVAQKSVVLGNAWPKWTDDFGSGWKAESNFTINGNVHHSGHNNALLGRVDRYIYIDQEWTADQCKLWQLMGGVALR